MLLNVLLVDMSSRVGLERGDREIGDPSYDDAEIDDIPDEATDVFLADSLRKNNIMIKIITKL